MVAQRGHGVAALPQIKPQAPTPVGQARSPRAPRTAPRLGAAQALEQRRAARLEDLARSYRGAQRRSRRLERLLANPDFYARDREGFTAAGAELTKIQVELAAAEEEWLRLELLREEIERA